MQVITITLSNEDLTRLREIAKHYRVTPEELARVGIAELLSRPEDQFLRAADHVLKKNAALYNRLA
jgi:predicted transcriptional regulator